jgi:HSP20 family protein
LLHAPPVEITETNDQVIVRAEVPGLSGGDIEVRIAPHHLVVTGKWNLIRQGETRVDRGPHEALHEVDLSKAINPGDVTATLEDGKLEIQMKKARRVKNILRAIAAA